MKLAVLCLCILHLAFVSAGLFICNNLQTGCSNVSVSRAQAPERTGPLNQGRHRTLFARRGQYERQRVRVPKPKVAPVPPNAPPPPSKVVPDPAIPKCSLLAQSCSPQSGCCDPCATCHCRFFNAICFCRKTNPQLQEENIKNTSTPKLRDKKKLKRIRS